MSKSVRHKAEKGISSYMDDCFCFIKAPDVFGVVETRCEMCELKKDIRKR